MTRNDHRQHVLSNWLTELDQRFQLGEVNEDTNKITWCQLLIGATGSGILSSLGKQYPGKRLRKLSSLVLESVLSETKLGPC